MSSSRVNEFHQHESVYEEKLGNEVFSATSLRLRTTPLMRGSVLRPSSGHMDERVEPYSTSIRTNDSIDANDGQCVKTTGVGTSLRTSDNRGSDAQQHQQRTSYHNNTGNNNNNNRAIAEQQLRVFELYAVTMRDTRGNGQTAAHAVSPPDRYILSNDATIATGQHEEMNSSSSLLPPTCSIAYSRHASTKGSSSTARSALQVNHQQRHNSTVEANLRIGFGFRPSRPATAPSSSSTSASSSFYPRHQPPPPCRPLSPPRMRPEEGVSLYGGGGNGEGGGGGGGGVVRIVAPALPPSDAAVRDTCPCPPSHLHQHQHHHPHSTHTTGSCNNAVIKGPAPLKPLLVTVDNATLRHIQILREAFLDVRETIRQREDAQRTRAQREAAEAAAADAKERRRQGLLSREAEERLNTILTALLESFMEAKLTIKARVRREVDEAVWMREQMLSRSRSRVGGRGQASPSLAPPQLIGENTSISTNQDSHNGDDRNTNNNDNYYFRSDVGGSAGGGLRRYGSSTGSSNIGVNSVKRDTIGGVITTMSHAHAVSSSHASAAVAAPRGAERTRGGVGGDYMRRTTNLPSPVTLYTYQTTITPPTNGRPKATRRRDFVDEILYGRREKGKGEEEEIHMRSGDTVSTTAELQVQEKQGSLATTRNVTNNTNKGNYYRRFIGIDGERESDEGKKGTTQSQAPRPPRAPPPRHLHHPQPSDDLLGGNEAIAPTTALTVAGVIEPSIHSQDMYVRGDGIHRVPTANVEDDVDGPQSVQRVGVASFSNAGQAAGKAQGHIFAESEGGGNITPELVRQRYRKNKNNNGEDEAEKENSNSKSEEFVDLSTRKQIKLLMRLMGGGGAGGRGNVDDNIGVRKERAGTRDKGKEENKERERKKGGRKLSANTEEEITVAKGGSIGATQQPALATRTVMPLVCSDVGHHMFDHDHQREEEDDSTSPLALFEINNRRETVAYMSSPSSSAAASAISSPPDLRTDYQRTDTDHTKQCIPQRRSPSSKSSSSSFSLRELTDHLRSIRQVLGRARDVVQRGRPRQQRGVVVAAGPSSKEKGMPDNKEEGVWEWGDEEEEEKEEEDVEGEKTMPFPSSSSSSRGRRGSSINILGTEDPHKRNTASSGKNKNTNNGAMQVQGATQKQQAPNQRSNMKKNAGHKNKVAEHRNNNNSSKGYVDAADDANDKDFDGEWCSPASRAVYTQLAELHAELAARHRTRQSQTLSIVRTLHALAETNLNEEKESQNEEAGHGMTNGLPKRLPPQLTRGMKKNSALFLQSLSSLQKTNVGIVDFQQRPKPPLSSPSSSSPYSSYSSPRTPLFSFPSSPSSVASSPLTSAPLLSQSLAVLVPDALIPPSSLTTNTTNTKTPTSSSLEIKGKDKDKDTYMYSLGDGAGKKDEHLVDTTSTVGGDDHDHVGEEKDGQTNNNNNNNNNNTGNSNNEEEDEEEEELAKYFSPEVAAKLRKGNEPTAKIKDREQTPKHEQQQQQEKGPSQQEPLIIPQPPPVAAVGTNKIIAAAAPPPPPLQPTLTRKEGVVTPSMTSDARDVMSKTASLRQEAAGIIEKRLPFLLQRTAVLEYGSRRQKALLLAEVANYAPSEEDLVLQQLRPSSSGVVSIRSPVDPPTPTANQVGMAPVTYTKHASIFASFGNNYNTPTTALDTTAAAHQAEHHHTFSVSVGSNSYNTNHGYTFPTSHVPPPPSSSSLLLLSAAAGGGGTSYGDRPNAAASLTSVPLLITNTKESSSVAKKVFFGDEELIIPPPPPPRTYTSSGTQTTLDSELLQRAQHRFLVTVQRDAAIVRLLRTIEISVANMLAFWSALEADVSCPRCLRTAGEVPFPRTIPNTREERRRLGERLTVLEAEMALIAPCGTSVCIACLDPKYDFLSPKTKTDASNIINPTKYGGSSSIGGIVDAMWYREEKGDAGRGSRLATTENPLILSSIGSGNKTVADRRALLYDTHSHLSQQHLSRRVVVREARVEEVALAAAAAATAASVANKQQAIRRGARNENLLLAQETVRPSENRKGTSSDGNKGAKGDRTALLFQLAKSKAASISEDLRSRARVMRDLLTYEPRVRRGEKDGDDDGDDSGSSVSDNDDNNDRTDTLSQNKGVATTMTKVGTNEGVAALLLFGEEEVGDDVDADPEESRALKRKRMLKAIRANRSERRRAAVLGPKSSCSCRAHEEGAYPSRTMSRVRELYTRYYEEFDERTETEVPPPIHFPLPSITARNESENGRKWSGTTDGGAATVSSSVEVERKERIIRQWLAISRSHTLKWTEKIQRQLRRQRATDTLPNDLMMEEHNTSEEEETERGKEREAASSLLSCSSFAFPSDPQESPFTGSNPYAHYAGAPPKNKVLRELLFEAAVEKYTIKLEGESTLRKIYATTAASPPASTLTSAAGAKTAASGDDESIAKLITDGKGAGALDNNSSERKKNKNANINQQRKVDHSEEPVDEHEQLSRSLIDTNHLFEKFESATLLFNRTEERAGLRDRKGLTVSNTGATDDASSGGTSVRVPSASDLQSLNFALRTVEAVLGLSSRSGDQDGGRGYTMSTNSSYNGFLFDQTASTALPFGNTIIINSNATAISAAFASAAARSFVHDESQSNAQKIVSGGGGRGRGEEEHTTRGASESSKRATSSLRNLLRNDSSISSNKGSSVRALVGEGSTNSRQVVSSSSGRAGSKPPTRPLSSATPRHQPQQTHLRPSSAYTYTHTHHNSNLSIAKIRPEPTPPPLTNVGKRVSGVRNISVKKSSRLSSAPKQETASKTLPLSPRPPPATSTPQPLDLPPRPAPNNIINTSDDAVSSDVTTKAAPVAKEAHVESLAEVPARLHSLRSDPQRLVIARDVLASLVSIAGSFAFCRQCRNPTAEKEGATDEDSGKKNKNKVEGTRMRTVEDAKKANTAEEHGHACRYHQNNEDPRTDDRENKQHSRPANVSVGLDGLIDDSEFDELGPLTSPSDVHLVARAALGLE